MGRSTQVHINFLIKHLNLLLRGDLVLHLDGLVGRNHEALSDPEDLDEGFCCEGSGGAQ